ncbi:hypothetical protein PJI16_16175 [Nitrospira sp. MA-1]|nr:hypothetical protein [Nitrospira sp. MA-1]
MSANPDRYLLVPMSVDALLVGKEAHLTTTWSDISPRFADILQKWSYLGVNIVGLLDKSKWTPKPGVHLHWALPEAMARASEDGGTESGYPLIPNRWLVERFVESSDGSVAVCSWLVESDALDGDQEGSHEKQISILDLKAAKLVTRLGACKRLAEGGPWEPKEEPFRIELTALGWGDPAFATYYPACKGVLGFHDPAPPTLGKGQRLGYLVVGWYSERAKDPLQRPLPPLEVKLGEKSRKRTPIEQWNARLTQQKWSCEPQSKEPAEPATRTACHGAVVDIAWRGPDQRYATGAPDPDGYRVAVGNSSIEALSALLRPAETDPANTDTVLQGLQHGILSRELDPIRLSDELHLRRFGASDGGAAFAIQERRAAKVGESAPPVEVPERLEAALEKLNSTAESLARRRRELAAERQQLYGAWCLWANDYLDREGPEPAENTPLTDRKVALEQAVEKSVRDLTNLENDLKLSKTALDKLLADGCPDLEVADATFVPFYQPNEPTVVISGDGLGRASRFQANAKDEALPCRLPEALVDSLLIDIPNGRKGNVVRARQLFVLKRDVPIGSAFGELIDSLLREAMLLETVNVERIGRKAYEMAGLKSTPRLEELLEDIRAFVERALRRPSLPRESQYTRLAEYAAAPGPASQSVWTRNPWLPFQLQWEVEWESEYKPVNWSPTKNWELSQESGDLVHRRGATNGGGSQASRELSSFSGWTILNPDSTHLLRRSLQESGSESRDSADMKAFIARLASPSVLSQTLGGFNEALLQLDTAVQLPPVSPAFLVSGEGEPEDPVGQLVATAQLLSPDTGKSLFPVRSGTLRLKNLWIVDAFGQTLKLKPEDLNRPKRPVRLLPADGAPEKLALPPRLSQPARLRFVWEPALPTAVDAAAASPIHGWLVPNRLDRSFLVYNAAGKVLGAIQKTLRVNAVATGGAPDRGSKAFFWVPVPNDSSPDSLSFYQDLASDDSSVWESKRPDSLSEEDATLAAFVDYLLALEINPGNEFHALVERLLGSKNTANPQDDPLLSILVGRALALVTASLSIELAEKTAVDWDKSAAVADSYTKIPFPLRLGDAGDPHDGLIGVLGGDAGAKVFYPAAGAWASTGGHSDKGAIEYEHDWTVNANSATRTRVTMLVDPHRPVVARTGILPAKRAALPARVVSSVAGVRDVFFVTAPVLGTSDMPRMPVPSDDYGQWSWAVRPEVTKWRQNPEIGAADDRARFGSLPQQLNEGWLCLRMNPVVILSFWVREGATKVPPNTNIRLAWKVQGADRVTLGRQDIAEPDKVWEEASLAQSPEWEGPVRVAKTETYVLTAFDNRGNTSKKTVTITVEREGAQ